MQFPLARDRSPLQKKWDHDEIAHSAIFGSDARTSYINMVNEQLRQRYDAFRTEAQCANIEAAYDMFNSTALEVAEQYFTTKANKSKTDDETTAVAEKRAYNRSLLRSLPPSAVAVGGACWVFHFYGLPAEIFQKLPVSLHVSDVCALVAVSRSWCASAAGYAKERRLIDTNKQLDKKLRTLFRRQRAHRKAKLAEELHEAWLRRDVAACWKISRKLAGKIGPKFRTLNAPRATLSRQDWSSYLSAPASAGGFCAVDERFVPPARFSEPVLWSFPELGEEASDLHKAVARSIAVAPLRKVPKEGCLPTGLLRMLVAPRFLQASKRQGLGFKHPRVETTYIWACLRWLFLAVLSLGRCPRSWHVSTAFTIPKQNAKQGCAGQRLLHSVDPLGAHVASWAWNRLCLNIGRPYSYGYQRGKRREQAIAQIAVVSQRLAANKLSHSADFYDACNAFPSPSKQILSETLVGAEPLWCSMLLQDRLDFAATTLSCADGPLFLRIGSGTLPGDKVAAQWFLAAYNDATDRFRQHVSGEPVFVDCSALRNFICETDEEKQELLTLATSQVDVSMATYADDIARIRRFHNMRTYISTLIGQADALDQALATVNCTQNREKLACLPRVFGKNANITKKLIFHNKLEVPGRAEVAARYLGPYLHINGFHRSEVERRLSAANRNFMLLSRFWCATGNNRWKGIMFKAGIQSAQFSGLAALPVAKTCLQALDRQTAVLARRAVLGACALEGNSGHAEALATKEVLKKLRTHLPSIQLAKQKLAWWQKIVAKPVPNFLLLAALFGKATWDSKNPIRDDGRAHETQYAFLAELLELLVRLARVSDLEEVIDDILKFPLLLFCDAEIRDRFLAVDVTLLEAEARSVCIPPPGWTAPALLPSEPASRVWRCGINGCSAAFSTRKGLVIHKVHSKQDGHGTRILANVITVNNQCVLCNRYFASITTAKQHTRRSIEKNGDCAKHGSSTIFTNTTPGPFRCRLCELIFEDLQSARFHMLSHLPANCVLSL